MMFSTLRLHFLFVILTVAAVTDAVIYSRCSLATTLNKSYGFPKNQLADWVCLIEAESGRNTAVVGPPNSDGSRDYGLFQINSFYWCSSGPASKHNECKVKCSSLIDSNISDDVKCAKFIFNRHTFSAWYGWRNKCKGRNISHYLKGCKL